MTASLAGLPTQSTEPFLSRKQLADLMNVSPATIDRMRREGMPYVDWSSEGASRKLPRFRASNAIAWAVARQ